MYMAVSDLSNLKFINPINSNDQSRQAYLSNVVQINGYRPQGSRRQILELLVFYYLAYNFNKVRDEEITEKKRTTHYD